MTDYLDKLNPQQREAVTTVAGPVLVLAGPGSGKTRVLTHRIAYLIDEMRVPAHHIVAVTFTNKAAGEMRERVEALLGGHTDGLQIGTFHAICARILRVEAGMGALPYNRDYVIYDTDDQISVVKSIMNELNVDTKKFQPGRVLSAISSAKNELIAPEDYSVGRDYFSEIVRRVYPLYQRRLVSNNAMDFDDLLVQTVWLLRDNELVREKYQRRFEYVMVDEFQDTNQAQYQLVKTMGRPQDNVFVVGDEDQGIYAFRGADYRNVMQFRQDYLDTKVILLEQNYRSTQVVLDTARAVIDRNKHRTPKALFTDRAGGQKVTVHEAYTENDEGEFIVSTIRKLMKARSLTYRDFAIMYRTNAQSRALEDACVNGRIPYRLVGGVGFYKRREVKDLLAYLRVINNGADAVSFARVVNTPGRGIGEKSVEAFADWAARGGYTIGTALDAVADGAVVPLTGRAAKSLVEFARMIRELRGLAELNDLTIIFDHLLTRTGYVSYITQESDTDEQALDRVENIDELKGVISQKRDLSLSDFLSETSLVAEIDSLDPNADTVTLLTLHAAKGLEYPVVFIAGLEEGLLPHSRSLNDPEGMAEERRLLYVGVTRAKDELYLSYAFRRTLYGDSQLATSSRFLEDIPVDLTEGLSTRVKSMRERSGYLRETRWDSSDNDRAAPSWDKPDRAPDQPSTPVIGGSGGSAFRDKIIPFPGSGGAKPAKPPSETKFKTGMKVFHGTFGPGIVINSKKVGDDEEVNVRFDKVGFKVLSANFARLTILP